MTSNHLLEFVLKRIKPENTLYVYRAENVVVEAHVRHVSNTRWTLAVRVMTHDDEKVTTDKLWTFLENDSREVDWAFSLLCSRINNGVTRGNLEAEFLDRGWSFFELSNEGVFS